MKPPSHWTSHSHGIQRYRHRHVTGDEIRPLELTGEVNLNGCAAESDGNFASRLIVVTPRRLSRVASEQYRRSPEQIKYCLDRLRFCRPLVSSSIDAAPLPGVG